MKDLITVPLPEYRQDIMRAAQNICDYVTRFADTAFLENPDRERQNVEILSRYDVSLVEAFVFEFLRDITRLELAEAVVSATSGWIDNDKCGGSSRLNFSVLMREIGRLHENIHLTFELTLYDAETDSIMANVESKYVYYE